MTKAVLEAIARNSLSEAARQRRDLGDLFCENQFRYIVMSRLSNNGTFGRVGYANDPQVTRSLVLELNYWSNLHQRDMGDHPGQIDLASIKKNSIDNYDNARYEPQPLAVETKVNHNAPGLNQDLNSCRGYLRETGSMRFSYAMLLVAGTRMPVRINPIESARGRLLYGYLDEDLNPVLYWVEN